MFSRDAENSHVGAGVAGGVLAPTRFVWPYGGRRVFVTGSFTGIISLQSYLREALLKIHLFSRWSEHIPMSPVEGCPTVFQVICRLSPGLHQYKFYVDGEWRHDDRQPFITGNYGIVNTICILSEPNPLAALPSPGTPNNRMGMDVDNETFHHATALSEGTIQGGTVMISEEDIKISRSRISVFLSSHTAYDLLPDSGKVVALDVNLPVKQAFHILYEQGIPVAPLWDSLRCQFVGVLSALDFILILQELGNRGSNLTEEELETHTIYAWKEGKHQLFGQLENHSKQLQSRMIHAGPYDSLKDVAVKILQNEVSTVPIMHQSTQDDDAFPQLLHLASLSGILKCICRHFRHSSSSLPILQQPICNIPLGTWDPRFKDQIGRPLVMLRRNSSLSLALSLLIQAKVSSIPIVDENDSFVDIYSRSDITALAKDRVYAQIHLDKMSIQQALQLGHDAPSHGGFDGQRCQMCLRTDPLMKVMERLANPGVRRVIIVEAGSKRVEGIISLSDVFRFLLC